MNICYFAIFRQERSQEGESAVSFAREQNIICSQTAKHSWTTLRMKIAFLDDLRMYKTNINALVQSIERSLHLIYKNRFSIKQWKSTC